MKKDASRLRILSVYDLSASDSLRALKHLRRQALSLRQEGVAYNDVSLEGDDILRRVYEMVGGRTSFLSRVARADDMLGELRKGLVDGDRGGRGDDPGREGLVVVEVSVEGDGADLVHQDWADSGNG